MTRACHRSFSGHPLDGDKIVRLIYMDEAGTSAKEPVSVVASVIVDANTQWKVLADALEEAFDELVPDKFRSGFVFHAKELIGGKRYQQEWPFSERFALVCRVASLPRTFNAAISLGKVFRCDGDPHRLITRTVKAYEMDHILAFISCLEKSDYYLRTYAPQNELGTVIAEDLPRMKRYLSLTALTLKKQQFVVDSDQLLPSIFEAVAGLKPPPYVQKIERIIDVPHFVESSGAPLLQIADACAYSFRRCLAGQRLGPELVMAMLGPKEGFRVLFDPVWYSGMGSGSFHEWS